VTAKIRTSYALKRVDRHLVWDYVGTSTHKFTHHEMSN